MNILDSRVVRAAWGVLGLAIMSCKTKDAPGPLEPTGPTGRIRFVNLIADPTRNPVNAILENVPFGVNLGYTASTPSSLPAPNTANYAAVYSGARTLVLKKTADTSVTVASFALTLTPNTDVTVFALGVAGGPVGSFTAVDDNAKVASGATRVHLVNMRLAAPADVDVFITAPNADLATATPVASLSSKTNTYVTTIVPGTYQVRFVQGGTAPANRAANVVASISSLALASGAARTIIVADNASGGNPSTAFVLTDQ